uniref:SLC36A1 n=1 Tax=Heterorhabditis bacteriophora TaxID=37862 RepID=A0A1I7XEX7_HETBA
MPRRCTAVIKNFGYPTKYSLYLIFGFCNIFGVVQYT